MADPYVTDDVQAQWGLRPDAPSTAPTQTPSQPAAPLDFSERQRWGTQPLPGGTRFGATEGQFGEGSRYEVPHAMETRPPPVPQGPPQQYAVDDAREWDRSKEEEILAYSQGRPKSIVTFRDIPESFTLEQHPDYQKWINAQGMAASIADRRERAEADKMVKQFGDRIKADTAQKNKLATEERHKMEIESKGAPYQSVDQRDKTAAAITTHLTTVLSETLGNVNSGDPAIKRQADFDRSVSPIMTMSRPKAGGDAKAKPDATNRDYGPLRDAAAALATHNRDLDGAAAVRALIKMGTFGGGVDEKGKQIPGFNGRTGAGAANYKVIGRDATDNVLVQLDNGMRLRVPPETYRLILDSRQQSAQRARQWEEEYKKSQEPSLLRRGFNEVLKLVPEKGF